MGVRIDVRSGSRMTRKASTLASSSCCSSLLSPFSLINAVLGHSELLPARAHKVLPLQILSIYHHHSSPISSKLASFLLRSVELPRVINSSDGGRIERDPRPQRAFASSPHRKEVKVSYEGEQADYSSVSRVSRSSWTVLPISWLTAT
ncbi:uncharacterized protein [Triticum aestivum]|uniref:uncharacterized protein isoform X2 n=1 Tax=Triticum aestivum TaxID=4565 RepID=UPI001D020538|nr:uncharacterized protein LOC123098478 isoform X2 [Triticum aestivum]